MGNFYANVVVRGVAPEAVRDVLAGRGIRALVTPALRGHVVVYEERSDAGDAGRLAEIARLLSAELQATALGALNHDDDVLLLRLFHAGRGETTYVTLRGVLYGLGLTPNALLPIAAAFALCRRFGRLVHLPYVWLVLQLPHLFQVIRHARLATTLGLPAEAVVLGHRYVTRGELPPGVERRDLLES